MRHQLKLLIVMGVIAVFVLAACGGGATSTPSPEPTDVPPTATAEVQAATEEVTEEAVMTEEATEEAVMTEEATEEAVMTEEATEEATEVVALAPTDVPTVEPTAVPTDEPTEVPPTEVPPTDVPTVEPTAVPPTEVPPTEVPPTDVPTVEPTTEPTAVPTEEATEEIVAEVTMEATEEVVTPEPPTKTITQLAINDNDLSTFMAAVVRAGLLNRLGGEGPFTVFIPSNEAFKKLPNGLLDAIKDNNAALSNLILYHVVEGAVSGEDVMNMETVMMLNGAEVTIEVKDGEVTIISNNGTTKAKIVTTDIQATNGVIHVIDTVLLPKPGTGNAGN